MKILSIREATEFYNTVLPYLPDGEVTDIVEFAGKIVDDIIEADQHDVYVQALMGLTGFTLEEIQEMDGMEVAVSFVEGLVENQVDAMMVFFDNLGFTNG